MNQVLQVKMLGSFTLTMGKNTVDDSSNRMRKIWLLLAFLIQNRGARIPQEKFFSLFPDDDSADPAGKLKTMFYRARTLLDQLGDGMGHKLIIHRGGCYFWNEEFPLELDISKFEALCTAAAAENDPEVKMQTYLQALDLYDGDFLPKLSMESWVMSVQTYYHERYLSAVLEILSLLREAARWPDALRVCEKALRVEPYSEELYQQLMRCRIMTQDRAGAVSAYDEMSEKLFSTFGVMPSEESRQLYRQAMQETNTSTVPAGVVREQLKEESAGKGALYCKYDFFRMLYQVQARAIARSGDVVHIALVSLHGRGKKELARRSLDIAMDNLQTLIGLNLRQGDTYTRCSLSQFIIMLPGANYENSGMVCDRISRAFTRQYPHSPAELRFSVQPLEPHTPPTR